MEKLNKTQRKQALGEAGGEALQFGTSAAMVGASVGGVPGAAIGFGIGALVGGTAGFFSGRKNTLEQQRLSKEQERLARQQTEQQRRLSKELGASASKAGKTGPVTAPPSDLFAEAMGSGTGFDAWHRNTFS